jgi:hypothetical protein
VANYRLRTAKRDSNGRPVAPLLNDLISAENDQEAIRKARSYEVDRLIDNTDYAWLTNDAERRPADVIGNAVHVMRIATGEIEETNGFVVKRLARWPSRHILPPTL